MLIDLVTNAILHVKSLAFLSSHVISIGMSNNQIASLEIKLGKHILFFLYKQTKIGRVHQNKSVTDSICV